MTPIVSADGTHLAVRSLGTGPPLVVVPGNNRRAHHYDALAADLGRDFTVHVLERRGRGESGPQGALYSIEREADDVLAVVDATMARAVVGHSYGGLAALHAALRRPLGRLVVYEPGVSIAGSFDASWLEEFTRLVDAGRHNAAMTLFLARTRLAPIGDAPKLVFAALAFLLLRDRDTRAMMRTTPAELREVVRLDSDGSRYAAIATPTLLLGGDRSPRYLTDVLGRLAALMPAARAHIVAGLDHNAPDLNAPAVVAAQIRAYVS